ncbi:MAG: aldehyde dehydrogenase family protein [Lentisphaeria bacterium]
MSVTHLNCINGAWVPSAGGETYEQRNPADLTQVTARFQKSTLADTRAAVAAAKQAFPAWAALSVYQRADYLNRALQLMKERIESIAAVITAENGKTLKEARGEVVSAIKEMEFQINEGVRLGGEMLPTTQAGVLAYQIRRPIGPVAVIAPWNFPFNVPARKITPALMAGNTCVLKPAQLTSGAGVEFVRLYVDAGLPPGVLNLVTGSGKLIGDELVTHPDIHAITFTGSTEVGMAIHEKAAPGLKRTQLEMGGKNPLVVMADADLEAAAASAALAAFACAGQWCISTSRALVHRSVLAPFLELLKGQVAKIVVGAGTEAATTMGPVCGEAQLKGVLKGIEKAKAEGARLLCGGEQLTAGGKGAGCFVAPTVFTEVTPEMSIAQEEIFGPVLAVMVFDDFEEAVTIANGVRYGLGASIYTRDLAQAMAFVNRIEAGLAHVNMHTAYKEPQFSFGGVKLSGHGIPEAGKTGIEFFTEHKTIFIKPVA